MANIDRFMVAPILSGQQTDQKPFLIPDDAFEELTNAYIFRGRVKKRFGAKLMNGASSISSTSQLGSRLRLKIGKTDLITGNKVIAPVPGLIWKIGQLFSVGTTIFTVYQGPGVLPTYSTGIATATYDTGTGNLAITGNGENPDTDIYFYPSTPVMGLITYDSPFINDEPVIGFDQQFSYLYNNGAWDIAGTTADKWSGNDSDFFYGTNWRGIDSTAYNLYVVNNVPNDGIRFWNGTIWKTMDPPRVSLIAGGGGNYVVLQTCRLIIPYHGRLLALNVWEKNEATGASENFPARIRWSQLGSAVTEPGNNTAWLQNPAGKGGFLDASTKEQIVSCAFIKDHLIIYFERSTWELVFTGNQADPFYFQRINQELGSESTFSIVPFDKVILGIGNVGVHACTGANVERIDNKIPDSVFQISNGNIEVKRVCGIRDFYTQMVYWAFPYNADSSYPNRILVYNYMTMSWAFNDDSITSFGYYQDRNIGATWASTSQTWAQMSASWNSGIFESRFRNILAGNQEGFVFIISSEKETNSPALQITNLTATLKTDTSWDVEIYVADHNLQVGDYIKIEAAQGVTVLNNKIFKIQSIPRPAGVTDKHRIVILYSYDPDAIPAELPYSGLYIGGGTITRVSNIDIKTKQYNFYMAQGRNAFISKVDFNVDKTQSGQVTVDTFVGSSRESLIIGGTATGSMIGTSVLETYGYPIYTYERYQDRVWHPIYLQGDGECIQLHIYMTEKQMLNPDISESKFELNAMTFYATPTASRLQ